MQILVQDAVAAAAEWTCGPLVLLGIDAHGLKEEKDRERSGVNTLAERGSSLFPYCHLNMKIIRK